MTFGKDQSVRKKATDEQIVQTYKKTHNIWKTGKLLGMCGQSVHERLLKMGIKCDGSGKGFTEAEKNIIKAEYSIYRANGKVKELARRLNCGYGGLVQQAQKLGLLDSQHAKKWAGKWKYMSEECARILFDKFKHTKKNLAQFCSSMGIAHDSFRKVMKKYYRDEWDFVIESKTSKQSKYRLGRQLEYRVLDELREKGYYALRSPRSGGKVDVLGICKSLIIFVQCKRSGMISAKEWNELFELSESVKAIPLIASTPTGRGTVYKRPSKIIEKGEKRKASYVFYEIPYVDNLAY